MQFSILALSLFAAAGLAAPVANAEAKAEAEAAPCFMSSLLESQSHTFDVHGACEACESHNDNGVNLGANANIFLTPSGCLTYGNTIEGSVAFQGTVINGNLYANSPFINNGFGCVNFNNEGQLYIETNINFSVGWYVQNNDVVPYGQQVYACPDEHGNHFLYCGEHHHPHERKHVHLSCH